VATQLFLFPMLKVPPTHQDRAMGRRDAKACRHGLVAEPEGHRSIGTDYEQDRLDLESEWAKHVKSLRAEHALAEAETLTASERKYSARQKVRAAIHVYLQLKDCPQKLVLRGVHQFDPDGEYARTLSLLAKADLEWSESARQEAIWKRAETIAFDRLQECEGRLHAATQHFEAEVQALEKRRNGRYREYYKGFLSEHPRWQSWMRDV
jgi:hypothetical protein